MSVGVCGNDNRATDNDLSYAVQSACNIGLGGDNELVREECNQSNKHDESGKPCESNKCTCDPGSNASCTCTGAPSGTATCGGATTCRSTASSSRGATSSNNCAGSIISQHFNTTSGECNTVTDYIERDYADYIAATGTQGQGAGTRVRDSIEPRNFKQANADSGDTVERRIGIPAGVTI